MIIKIKSHKREVFQKILEYMIIDKDRVLKDGRTFTLIHNLKGRSIEEWVNQFKANELQRTRRRKDSVRLTHEILSWHRDDSKNLTLEKMKDMAQEYIRLRNPKGIYVAAPHFDKNHFHIHICASGIEYRTGKSLRLSKADMLHLKKSMRNYQKEKFPELSNSVPHLGRKDNPSLTEKEFQFKLRTGKESDNEKLVVMLAKCFKEANSKDMFFKLLIDCNLKTYERGGKINGIIFNGQKFRFKRLGFNEDKIESLEKANTRGKCLSEIKRSKIERSKIDRVR